MRSAGNSLLDAALANLKAAYPALAKIKMAETWTSMIDTTLNAGRW